MKKMDEQAWVGLLQKERFEPHRELFKEREWWVNFCRWKRAQHGITRRSAGGTLHKMRGRSQEPSEPGPKLFGIEEERIPHLKCDNLSTLRRPGKTSVRS